MTVRAYNVHGRYIPHTTNNCLYGSGSIIEDVLEYSIIERYHTIQLKNREFTTIDCELPDTKNDVKDIANAYRMYGKYVAILLVDTSLPEKERKLYFEKVLWINERVKEINKYPDALLNIIPVDYNLAVFGELVLDVVKLDKLIRDMFPNIVFSTSMKQMIFMMFGKIGVELIDRLLQ